MHPQGSLRVSWDRRKASEPSSANISRKTRRRYAKGVVKLVGTNSPPASTNTLRQITQHADQSSFDAGRGSRTARQLNEPRRGR